MAVDVDDRELRPRHQVLRRRPASTSACTRGCSAAGIPARGLRPAAAGSARAGCCCDADQAERPAGDQNARARRTRRSSESRAECRPSRRCEKTSQQAVSRILFRLRPAFAALGRRMTTIPLAPPLLAGSSDLPGDFGRAVRSGFRRAPPYLVLLRAGFCLPPVLPRARCALTAPFHPYSPAALRGSAEQALQACLAEPRASSGRYIFCATVLQVTLTGRYPAHCPAEFGLSSPAFAPFGASATAAVWLTATPIHCTACSRAGCANG